MQLRPDQHTCATPALTACASQALNQALHACLHAQDLSDDKMVAQADLHRTLGTLRYLRTLQANRQRQQQQQQGQQHDGGGNPPQVIVLDGAAAAAQQDGDGDAPAAAAQGDAPPAAAAEPPQAGSGGSGGGAAAAAAAGRAGGPVGEICPICHDAMPAQFAMLPCGHMVCPECMAMLLGHAAGGAAGASAQQQQQQQRRVACPTCRTRHPVDEVSQVDTGGKSGALQSVSSRRVPGKTLAAALPLSFRSETSERTAIQQQPQVSSRVDRVAGHSQERTEGGAVFSCVRGRRAGGTRTTRGAAAPPAPAVRSQTVQLHPGAQLHSTTALLPPPALPAPGAASPTAARHAPGPASPTGRATAASGGGGALSPRPSLAGGGLPSPRGPPHGGASPDEGAGAAQAVAAEEVQDFEEVGDGLGGKAEGGGGGGEEGEVCVELERLVEPSLASSLVTSQTVYVRTRHGCGASRAGVGGFVGGGE